MVREEGRLNLGKIRTLELFLETLRKYATVGTLMRSATSDYKIPGTNNTIEKGTQVWIPVYAIHNDEGSETNPLISIQIFELSSPSFRALSEPEALRS